MEPVLKFNADIKNILSNETMDDLRSLYYKVDSLPVHSSNEDIADYILSIITTIDRWLGSISKVFHSFANRNSKDVHIYIRDLDKVKEKVTKIVNNRPEMYAVMQDKEIAYIKSCKIPLLPLTEKLAKVNSTLMQDINFLFEFVEDVVQSLSSDPSFFGSNRPIRDKRLDRLKDIEDSYTKLIRDIIDPNDLKDTKLFSEIVPNINSIYKSIDNIKSCTRYVSLQDYRKIESRTEDIVRNIEDFVSVAQDKENQYSREAIKFGVGVIRTSGSVISLFAGISDLIIESCKAIYSIGQYMEAYR